MTMTISIRTPADIPAAAAGVLGFHPENSLVVLGVPGPSARVDLDGDVDEVVGSISVAARHWTDRVLVAVYSDQSIALADIAAAFWRHMPTVTIAALIRVHDGMVYTDTGESMPARPAEGELVAMNVLDSRATLEAEADTVTDTEAAWTMAQTSYEVGNGARAWVYLDRYRTLLGGTDTRADDLDRKLVDAVDPRA